MFALSLSKILAHCCQKASSFKNPFLNRINTGFISDPQMLNLQVRPLKKEEEREKNEDGIV
jgi:hypothetical protein